MPDVYATVFRALDTAVAHNACLAASEAQIQRALTELRTSRRDPEATRRLESISVVLQQLSLASLVNDNEQRRDAVERLRFSARQWLLTMPISYSA